MKLCAPDEPIFLFIVYCLVLQCISILAIQSAVVIVILSVCLTVYLSYAVNRTQATIMRSSLEDSPVTLVSLRLTSPRNSEGT